MSISSHLPIYNKLSPQEQAILDQSAVFRRVSRGTIIHGGGTDCMGLLLVQSGQLRAFITSDAGKEITIYRLFAYDICLFSASCMMNSLQFDIMITAEKGAEFWLIPPNIYKELMTQNVTVANYTNEILAARFSDVMWLIEQVMWKSFDKRLAHFLLEESALEDSHLLKITHETVASHLGTAREVVTRMLKYFQSEGIVALTRGAIELVNIPKLEELNEA